MPSGLLKVVELLGEVSDGVVPSAGHGELRGHQHIGT